MKFYLAALTLIFLGRLASAQTAAQQEINLKNAGVTPLGAGFFSRGDMAVKVSGDGSFEILAPFEKHGPNQRAVAIKSDVVFNTPALKIVSKTPERQYFITQANANGSGSMSYGEIPKDMAALVGTSFMLQLAAAGFEPLESSHTVWLKDLGTANIVAFTTGQTLDLFKPIDVRIQKKLKKTLITNYVEKTVLAGEAHSGLAVVSDIMKFNVFGMYGGLIDSVEFLKDLADVDLSDLGFELPAPASDLSGFVIGGVNPSSLILGLTEFNGTSIGVIEQKAQKIAGCSHGDPLLAVGEDLKKVLAEDNDKVQKLGLTHQALAKPLLYAKAVVTGQFGNKFKLHGTEYEVSNLAMPMCGSLDSPFNDKYSTAIVFPRVTNLTTKKFIDLSYLHPYLINQYGFYGSHANRSYVSPEAIIDVFDYLKSGK